MNTLRRLPALAAFLIWSVLVSGLQMTTAGAAAPCGPAMAAAAHGGHDHGAPGDPVGHQGDDLCCCLAACAVTVVSTPEPLPPHRDLGAAIRLTSRPTAEAPRDAFIASTPPARGPPALV